MHTSMVSICIAKLIIAAVLLCTTSSDVHAWGDKGHRLIGHMAYALLTPKTRHAIQQLMGSDDLATFALYLDWQKDQLEQEIPGSPAWHYDNMPICTTKSYPEYCPNGACVSTQTLRHYRLLSDAHEPEPRKQFAVLVLTHLVGDMHQPLHASDNEDQGGSQIKVRLPDGRELNLHELWDWALVEHLYGGQDEMAVAKRLVQQYASQAEEWQTGPIDLAIKAWIEESNRLAKEVAYGKLPGFACGVDLEQTHIALTGDYLQDTKQVVEEQIAKAGYRLAALLNHAWGD
jgi:S1/P1 Nuclease